MNHYNDYLEKQNQVKDYCNNLSPFDIYKSSNAVRNALVAANRHHYLPGNDDDISFFKEYFFHNEMADIDLMHFPIIANKIMVNNRSGLQLNESLTDTIFCTFHLGSFRVIPLLLNYMKLNIGLAVDERTYNDQHILLENLHRTEGTVLGALQLMNVEKPVAGFQMANILKSNANLVFYADGNTGIDNKQRLKMPFLNSNIEVKQGIALLSYTLKTKIVPVFTYRVNNKNYVDFLSPIMPSRKQQKESYVKETTIALYHLFAGYLVQYPEQWEGWAYTHLPAGSCPTPKNEAVIHRNGIYRLNKERFVPILSDQNCFFDKYTSLSLKIPYGYEIPLYSILETEQISFKDIDVENQVFYKNLIVNEVLVLK